jgi:hypothetical protein
MSHQRRMTTTTRSKHYQVDWGGKTQGCQGSMGGSAVTWFSGRETSDRIPDGMRGAISGRYRVVVSRSRRSNRSVISRKAQKSLCRAG